jgi:hypothetical protein
MLQRTYKANLWLFAPQAPARIKITAVPLERCTKEELTLLSFIHGSDAVTDVRVDGTYDFHGVESQMDEYKRLADKYDDLSSPANRGQKGRMKVENCFRVTLSGFETLIDDINAADSADAKIAAAEAATAEAATVEAEVRVAAEEAREAQPMPTIEAPVGSGLGDTLANIPSFGRSKSEGVRP